MKKKIDNLKKQIEDSQGSSMLTAQQMSDLNVMLKTAQSHLNTLTEQQKQMSSGLASLTGSATSKAEGLQAGKSGFFVKPKGTK